MHSSWENEGCARCMQRYALHHGKTEGTLFLSSRDRTGWHDEVSSLALFRSGERYQEMSRGERIQEREREREKQRENGKWDFFSVLPIRLFSQRRWCVCACVWDFVSCLERVKVGGDRKEKFRGNHEKSIYQGKSETSELGSTTADLNLLSYYSYADLMLK